MISLETNSSAWLTLGLSRRFQPSRLQDLTLLIEEMPDRISRNFTRSCRRRRAHSRSPAPCSRSVLANIYFLSRSPPRVYETSHRVTYRRTSHTWTPTCERDRDPLEAFGQLRPAQNRGTSAQSCDSTTVRKDRCSCLSSCETHASWRERRH